MHVAALRWATRAGLWLCAWSQLLRTVSSDRVPRNLAFVGNGGTFKFIAGVMVPLDSQGSPLAWICNFQWQYDLPDNATYFTSPLARSFLQTDEVPQVNTTEMSVTIGDEEYDGDNIHRGVIYGALESVLSRKGVDGRACVLRSICEAAETPLHHDGLIGELLHTLLTPDYGSSSVELIDADYLKAQQAGRSGRVDCNYLYPECPRGFGLLDLFTAVKYF